MNKKFMLIAIAAVAAFALSSCMHGHYRHMKKMHGLIDQNHDEVITKEEYLVHFEQVDGNGDGNITPEERDAYHKKHGMEMRGHGRKDGKRAQRGFKMKDANDDGKISRSEFEAHFGKMDMDSDGKVDMDEMCDFHKEQREKMRK